jgi:mono/diheme cytochrome c family protein
VILRLVAVCLALLLVACRQDMHDQPRAEAFERSNVFANGSSARQPVPNTVARGMLNDDEHLYAGRVNGEPARAFPFDVTEQVLARGRERYDIYCSPCHGVTGDGNGTIVRKGFPPPPSLHTNDLRFATPGQLFDTITNGSGEMPDYSQEVPAQDRWAIIAYIRALQLSQHADVVTLPQQDREALERIR